MRRAVVAGSGIGGLITARILAERADQVVVVERDAFGATPAACAGTPQDVHPHQLLRAARLELERLFLGFTDDAVRHGAHFSCITRTHKIWGRLGWRPRYDSALWALVLTRHLIEWMVRQRVATLANVEIVTGHRAVGLAAGPGGATVTGLRTIDLATRSIPDDRRRPGRRRDRALVAGAADLARRARLPRPVERTVNAFWG